MVGVVVLIFWGGVNVYSDFVFVFFCVLGIGVW